MNESVLLQRQFLETLKKARDNCFEGKYFLFYTKSSDNICEESWVSVYRMINGTLHCTYSPSDYIDYQKLGHVEENFEKTTLKYLKDNNITHTYSSESINFQKFEELLDNSYEEFPEEKEEDLEIPYSGYICKPFSPNQHCFQYILDDDNSITHETLGEKTLEELLFGRKIIRGNLILDLNNNEGSIISTLGDKYIVKIEKIKKY